MTRTGGFAGDSLMIAVDQYGSYVVSRRDQPPAGGTMDYQAHRELTDALESAHLDTQEPVYSRHCADQFHYTFSYGDAYYATDDCPITPMIVSQLINGPLNQLIELSERPTTPKPSTTRPDGRAASTTSVSVNPFSTRSNTGPTIRATVANIVGTPEGTVTITVGSRTRTVHVYDGYADWTLPILTVGRRQITASYHGNGLTMPSTSPAETLNTVETASQVAARPQVNRDAKRLALYITVTTAKGVSPAGTVVVTCIGNTHKTVTVKVDAEGEAVVKIENFEPGSYLIRMTYLGNGVVSPSKNTVRIR